MAWTDNYVQGSFRGVPFFTVRATTKGGRKLAVHKYPLRDATGYQDLGEDEHTFSLSLYVIGDDYMAQRDALEAALQAGGSGVLVHPYRGKQRVVVESWTCTEDSKAGRMASYSVTFKLYEPGAQTAVAKSAKQAIVNARDVALGRLLAWFENTYDLATQPITSAQIARDFLGNAISVVRGLRKVASTQEAFVSLGEQMAGDIEALSLLAKDLGESLLALVTFGTSVETPVLFGATSENAAQQVSELLAVGDVVLAQETLGVKPAADIQTFVAASSVIAAGGLVPVTTFATYDDAQTVQQDIADRVDALVFGGAVDDATVAALRDLRAVLFAYVEEQLVQLPRLVEYRADAQTNVLALSFELYGTTTRADEITRRNNIVHPGIVPAGTVLQVVSE